MYRTCRHGQNVMRGHTSCGERVVMDMGQKATQRVENASSLTNERSHNVWRTCPHRHETEGHTSCGERVVMDMGQRITQRVENVSSWTWDRGSHSVWRTCRHGHGTEDHTACEDRLCPAGQSANSWTCRTTPLKGVAVSVSGQCCF